MTRIAAAHVREYDGRSARSRARSRDTPVRHKPNPSRRDSDAVVLTEQSSFRVYTPAQLRHAVMRPAYRPAPRRGFFEELGHGIARLGATSPLRVAKWAAVAVAITTVLFGGLVFLANATDDTLGPSKGYAQAIAQKDGHRSSAPKRPGGAAELSPSSQATPIETDFELPDDSLSAHPIAANPRASAKHAKREVRKRR